MIPTTDTPWLYDGSYEGLLCCVFESFRLHVLPCLLEAGEPSQLSLTPPRVMLTDPHKAARVQTALRHKLGQAVTEFFQSCFLTCLEDKELYMLRFMHLAFHVGPSVLHFLSNETVATLWKSVRHLENEAHLLKGFLRFSDYPPYLIAVIHPKNFVLPLLTAHFCDRFPEENFLIYDETHGCGLLQQKGKIRILPIDSLALSLPSETEQKYRALWQTYYKTAAIQARYNPACRMSHMPKRYWKYMTELGAAALTRHESTAPESLPPAPPRQSPFPES